MKRIRRYFFISLMLLIGSIVAFYLIRFTVYIYTSMQQISARAVEQSDYTKITTPLPTGVAHDLCVEFEISPTDRRCQNGMVVYGPDFFPDIKSYLLAFPNRMQSIRPLKINLGYIGSLVRNQTMKGITGVYMISEAMESTLFLSTLRKRVFIIGSSRTQAARDCFSSYVLHLIWAARAFIHFTQPDTLLFRHLGCCCHRSQYFLCHVLAAAEIHPYALNRVNRPPRNSPPSEHKG